MSGRSGGRIFAVNCSVLRWNNRSICIINRFQWVAHARNRHHAIRKFRISIHINARLATARPEGLLARGDHERSSSLAFCSNPFSNHGYRWYRKVNFWKNSVPIDFVIFKFFDLDERWKAKRNRRINCWFIFLNSFTNVFPVCFRLDTCKCVVWKQKKTGLPDSSRCTFANYGSQQSRIRCTHSNRNNDRPYNVLPTAPCWSKGDRDHIWSSRCNFWNNRLGFFVAVCAPQSWTLDCNGSRSRQWRLYERAHASCWHIFAGLCNSFVRHRYRA